MPQWRSIWPHCGDCSDDKRHHPPTFGGVRCGCECVMLTWVSSLSNQYRWGSISPPEALARFIRISVQWPFLKYGQYLPETYQVLYLQNATIWREQTQGSLSTNITQYRWMKGSYLMGCYHVKAWIDLSHHGSTSVGAPEWPPMSLVN